MAAERDFELLVIGGGPAGSGAANTAAKAGAKVALVEKDKLGGTCLNYGCDPTKTLLHSAHILRRAKNGAALGLKIASAEGDWTALQNRVQQVMQRIRGGTPEESIRKTREQGIEVIVGEGVLVGPNEVRVSGQVYRADHIIIAVGGESFAPPIDGLKSAGYITNREAIFLQELPKSIAIIGAGPIGVEFAQMFHGFGVEVTVLEAEEKLLPTEDQEVAEILCGLLTDAGIRMEINVDIQRVRTVQAGKKLTFRCDEGDVEELIVDEILIATGRRPDTESLGLKEAGVKLGDKGEIIVDDTLRTNVENIWVAGDATHKFPFTHVAHDQGMLAAKNALAVLHRKGKPQPFDYSVIPWVTFTDPPLAHVGQTEDELREDGVKYRSMCVKLEELEAAQQKGETDGVFKLLVSDDDKGLVLGAHMLGYEAGEQLAALSLAMKHQIPVASLAELIIAYPTFSAAIRWTARKLTEESA
jgi:pyruvate/2-oxoglutarate dehydrogenase complex dihydrolipoamide dehydrogenase (E3) component